MSTLLRRVAQLEASNKPMSDSAKQRLAYRLEVALFKAYGAPDSDCPTMEDFLQAGGADAQREAITQALDAIYGGE